MILLIRELMDDKTGNSERRITEHPKSIDSPFRRKCRLYWRSNMAPGMEIELALA